MIKDIVQWLLFSSYHMYCLKYSVNSFIVWTIWTYLLLVVMHADKQLCWHMVYSALCIYLCNWNFGAPMEWCGYWWLVEEWAVLGDWWHIRPSLRRVPRTAKGARRNWYQFHCDIKGIRWRWRFRRALCVQMDISSHSSNHCACDQHSRDSCRCVLCYQQWLPVLGATFWQALLRYMGDCPSLSIPQRSPGQTEQDSDYRHCLVSPYCLHLLVVVGAHWSVHRSISEGSCSRTMRYQLLILFKHIHISGGEEQVHASAIIL